MPEKTPPPVKRGDGSSAARGIKTGPPVDQNSDTLHGFNPVATAASPGAPSTAAPADETNPQADVPTLRPQYGGATMVPHDPEPVLGVRPPALDQTLAGPLGPSDQTLQASPDATLGGLDPATQAFHQAALAAAPKAVTPGQSFGHYELLEPIAKGGMGIVYKARQKKLNRIVAIKMILAGQFADQSDIDRFYAEAEAAAALSHPNIVAIHEIGEMNGQHFFSMDFIEGKSLSGLIHENPVPPRRAAEFARTIAETMQFAHDKGVVHRDLKPANILLDKRERPLITDFGLAKQVSNTSQLTMAGSIVGTPSYMPPEQAAGKIEEVGPWSDLYSLGAILYELLTGRPPFRASSPFETIRQVLETEPPSPRLLNPNVPKDLETICLKCLQKERLRRYTSCQELADELGRYLRGEPIHARPISQVARFWRLCKRNPITSSAIALAAVFFIAASIVSTAAYFQTKTALKRETAALNESVESQKKEKESRRIAMKAVDDLFTKVSEDKLLNQPGTQPLRRDLLNQALSYYEQFLKQRQDDPEVANELAAAQFRVGRIAVLLGSLDEAIKPLQTALKMQETLVSQKSTDPERLKALGDTLTQLAQVWIRKKEYETAGRVCARAVEVRSELTRAFPINVEYQRGLANAHMNAGTAAFNTAQVNPDNDEIFNARMKEAREQNEKAQSIRLNLLERDKSNAAIRRDLAKGYYNLGDLARVDDRVSDAIVHFKQAASTFEELLSEEPEDLENQGLLAVCNRLVGTLLVAGDQRAEARQWYELALEHLDKLVKENPDVAEYQTQQAGLLLSLFELEKKEGNSVAGRTTLARARKIYTPLAEKFPDVAIYQRELALTLRELAKEERLAGNEKDFKEDLSEAIRLLTDLVNQYPQEAEYAQRLNETKALAGKNHSAN